MVAYYNFIFLFYRPILEITPYPEGLYMILLHFPIALAGIVMFVTGLSLGVRLLRKTVKKRNFLVISSIIAIPLGFFLSIPLQVLAIEPIVRNIEHENKLEQSFEYAFEHATRNWHEDEHIYNHVRTHLENGADPVGKDPQNPLIAQVGFAGNIILMEMLLEYGADPNTAKDELTLLMFAARWNYEERVLLLLEYGADVNLTDNNGQTALDYANKYELKHPDAWGECRGSNERSIQALIDAGAVSGRG